MNYLNIFAAKKYSCIVFILLVIISGCGKKRPLLSDVVAGLQGNGYCMSEKETDSSKNMNTKLTIMIHGTARTANYVWFIPPLYRKLNLTLRTPCGLKHINELPQEHGFVECGNNLCARDASFDREHFYYFGWEGKLSFHGRYEAAEKLYATLKSLTNDPKYAHADITLITHSHGGNVALNLANIMRKNNDTSFSIDRLILLGCPIQDDTESFCCSEPFKNIYNIFTPADIFQVIDIQKLQSAIAQTFFSRRQVCKDYCQNCKQAKIWWTNRGLNHIDFIKPKFYTRLSKILCAMDNQECSHEPLELRI